MRDEINKVVKLHISSVFQDLSDPRIEFFIDKLRHDLTTLLALRNAALAGTGFGQARLGMKLNEYTITQHTVTSIDFADPSSSSTYYDDYHSEHGITVMMNIFFSSHFRRTVYANNDPLLRKRIAHKEDADEKKNKYYYFLPFAAMIALLAGTFHLVQAENTSDKEKMIGATLFLFASVIFCGYIVIRGHKQTEQYVKLLKAEFNDTQYDELLNRLCKNEHVENVEKIDWSHEIKVNENSCSIRTLILILFISFNDKIYSKIFSEILPKLIAGGKFDVHDETRAGNIIHIDSSHTHLLENSSSNYQAIGFAQ